MCRQFKSVKLAGAVMAVLAVSNFSWAITPDGTKNGNLSGGETQIQAEQQAIPSVTRPSAPAAGGLPILEHPSADAVKKSLGIGQATTRNLADVREAGFGSFIEFETDSATVIPSEGLRVIADALVDLEPGISIQITGHTDNVGGDSYNMGLSLDRANAVRDWLEGHGVRRGAIKTRGMGFHRPLCYSNSESCRSKNRRVEFSRIYE
jgi:outer membrane protein OmpA-like peptidoglycan-associated protein